MTFIIAFICTILWVEYRGDISIADYGFFYSCVRIWNDLLIIVWTWKNKILNVCFSRSLWTNAQNIILLHQRIADVAWSKISQWKCCAPRKWHFAQSVCDRRKNFRIFFFFGESIGGVARWAHKSTQHFHLAKKNSTWHRTSTTVRVCTGHVHGKQAVVVGCAQVLHCKTEKDKNMI